MNGMMDGGMIYGMGIIGLPGIVVLVLLIAALIEYPFFSRPKQ